MFFCIKDSLLHIYIINCFLYLLLGKIHFLKFKISEHVKTFSDIMNSFGELGTHSISIFKWSLLYSRMNSVCPEVLFWMCNNSYRVSQVTPFLHRYIGEKARSPGAINFQAFSCKLMLKN